MNKKIEKTQTKKSPQFLSKTKNYFDKNGKNPWDFFGD